MGLMRLGRGEWVRADMTAPARSVVFPFLETLATTGLVWIAIGYLDNPHTVSFEPIVRNVLVAVWALLLLFRFIMPVIRARRKRFILTNHRIIARGPGLRAGVDSIPLRQVRSARRYRGGISVALYGHDRPLYFPEIPKARKVEALISQSLTHHPGRPYRPDGAPLR